MKRLIGLVLFLLVGFLSESITWEFTLNRHKLTSLPFASSGHFPAELKGQTWKLQAQGGQSYVFVSEDGTRVLKFFKDQPRPWLKLTSYQALKNKKLHRTLLGYTLMQERCPEVSGIVSLHTEPSTSIPATLIDRLGNQHTIDLDSYLFVLQKKAELLEPPQNSTEKEHLLQEISSLLQTLASHHLTDHDPRLHLNLGRIGSKLVLIDPGKIAESETPSSELPDKFLEFIR